MEDQGPLTASSFDPQPDNRFAVLFDVDDTLIDYTYAEAHGLKSHLTALGVSDGYLDAALQRWREVTRIHVGRFHCGAISFTDQRRARTRDLNIWLGNPIHGEAELDGWYAGYLSRHQSLMRPFPDVLDCLWQLEGSPLGVVSNNDKLFQQEKLDAADLITFFEVIECPSAGMAGKPDPAIFHRACQRLDIAPSRTLYVGDQLDIDAQAARSAGLHGVWLDRARSGMPVDGLWRISSLRQVPEILKILQGTGPGDLATIVTEWNRGRDGSSDGGACDESP